MIRQIRLFRFVRRFPGFAFGSEVIENQSYRFYEKFVALAFDGVSLDGDATFFTIATLAPLLATSRFTGELISSTGKSGGRIHRCGGAS